MAILLQHFSVSATRLNLLHGSWFQATEFCTWFWSLAHGFCTASVQIQMNSPSRIHRLLLLLSVLVVLEYCWCRNPDTSLTKTYNSYIRSSLEDLSRRLDDGVTGESRSRQKRNLLQLGTEIIRSTKFSPIKLAQYGNW